MKPQETEENHPLLIADLVEHLPFRRWGGLLQMILLQEYFPEVEHLPFRRWGGLLLLSRLLEDQH